MPKVESETWKKIQGFERYEVSTHGEIRSLWFKNGKTESKRETPKKLRLRESHNGYLRTTVFNNGKPKSFNVHVVVLEAFVSKRPKGMQACHKDNDRKNNKLNNLRWDTIKNNHRDMIEHGTRKRPLDNIVTRLIEKMDLTQKQLGDLLGVGHRQISLWQRKFLDDRISDRYMKKLQAIQAMKKNAIKGE